MHLRRESLLVLGIVGIIIAIIMLIHYHSIPDRTEGTLFGLSQLLLGFSIGVFVGIYLGLKSEETRLEQIISEE